MFDFVYNNKRLVQVILALIAIPFALFGIDAFQRSTSRVDEIARVGGMPISRQEFDRAMQDQQDRMRQVLGRQFDASMFDTPSARDALVDQLVAQRLLGQYVVRGNLTVGNDELARTIGSIPAFQDDGKFAVDRYKALLRAQNMSVTQFEESMRNDLALQRVNGAIGESAIAARAITAQFLVLQSEKREIAEVAFTPGVFAGDVRLSPDAAETYYKANAKEFEVPARVRAEYVVLNPEMVAARETVSPDDVRAAYDTNFGAKAKERDAARKKIEEILSEVKRSPEKFAEIAKAQSQDTGSGAQGGDLGFFGRGMMVKPFEEAAFKLKPGELSGIVESEFGFHVIRLAEVKAGEKGEERRASHVLINAPTGVKPFEQARAEIEADLRKQRVAGKFAAEADKFQKLADQDQDSLVPFAEAFKLAPQTSGWLEQGRTNAQAGAIGNAKVIEALFKPEILAGKRATEAIEAAQNVMIVARVVESKPASQRPFEDARAEITKRLIDREAQALARKAGADRLAELRKNPNAAAATTKWGPARSVSREDPQGLPREAVAAVFKADTATLPVFVGIETPGGAGYSVYRIAKVTRPVTDDKRAGEMSDQLARLDARDQSQAFIGGLRERGKVEVNRATLEKRAPQ